LIKEDYSTLVLGASLKPERASNQAIHRLRAGNYKTIALGLRPGTVADVEIETDPGVVTPPFDTLTLYLNPKRQAEFEQQILEVWKPRRIIFNPGTENPAFIEKAHAAGIKTEVACTLVLLSLGKFED